MFARIVFGGTLGLFFCLLGIGCSGNNKVVPVQGVLTWEDGTPVDGATVTFMPQAKDGRQAAGLTGKDGSFTLTMGGRGEGAFAGDYKVVVVKAEETEEAVPPAMPGSDPTKAMIEWQKKQKARASQPNKRLIPLVYTSEKTTPLVQTVQPGNPRLELKLKKI